LGQAIHAEAGVQGEQGGTLTINWDPISQKFSSPKQRRKVGHFSAGKGIDERIAGAQADAIEK
jgi:hypothetical protein